MNIIETLLTDVEWRVSQLSSIRTLYLRYNFNEYDKLFFKRQSVVGIYAIWEGFIKNCSEEYLKHLNMLEIGFNAAHSNLKSYYFNSKINLQQPRTSKKSQTTFINIAHGIFNKNISFTIDDKLLRDITSSNVNFKQLRQIFQNFCLSPINVEKHEHSLDKLLTFRNKIAHGENAIKVDKNEISEFIDVVENLMYDCLIEFEQTIDNNLFTQSI